MKKLLLLLLLSLNTHAACVNSLTGAAYQLNGGSGNVSLTVDPGCAWNATADPWITPNPLNGTGSATINYTVASNTGVARVGYITIAGQNYRIDQAGDVTSPTVTITDPIDNTTYTTAQTVIITATASDNVGIDHVEFYDGVTFKGSDNLTPFTYSWSFTSADNGTHSWTAKAFDFAGNNTTSLPVSLIVNIGSGDTGAFQWVNTYGGTGQDFGTGTAFDTSGNVYLISSFDSPVNFGCGMLNYYTGSNILLEKHSPTGTCIWSKAFSGPGSGKPLSVVVDNTGNIYMTGYFVTSVNFGGTFLTSAGSQDIFVCKYNPNGALVWAKRFGSTDIDWGIGIAVSSNGDPVIVGYFCGTVDFGGGPFASVGGQGYKDGFIVKLAAATGDHIWSKQLASTSQNDQANAVAIDSSNNVFVTGRFGSTMDFGGGPLISAGGADVFLAKYDISGNYLWAQRFGAALVDNANSVAVDTAGNVAITGTFYNTVNFGGANLVSAGSADIFVAKYNSAGTHIFSARYGSTSDFDGGYGIAEDNNNNTIITGNFSGTVDFGGGAKVSNGAWDIFIAKYSSTGTHIWSKAIGGSNIDEGIGIAVDASRNIAIAGRFFNTVDFGGGPKTSTGTGDIYLLKLAP